MAFDAIDKRNRNVIKGTSSLQRLNKESIYGVDKMIVDTYRRHAISACDTPGKLYLYIRAYVVLRRRSNPPAPASGSMVQSSSSWWNSHLTGANRYVRPMHSPSMVTEIATSTG